LAQRLDFDGLDARARIREALTVAGHAVARVVIVAAQPARKLTPERGVVHLHVIALGDERTKRLLAAAVDRAQSTKESWSAVLPW
jgi:hypothetical protein